MAAPTPRDMLLLLLLLRGTAWLLLWESSGGVNGVALAEALWWRTVICVGEGVALGMVIGVVNVVVVAWAPYKPLLWSFFCPA